MRVLTVRHVSTYRYSKRVALGDHWMMFRPRASHDLRLVGTEINILPLPRAVVWLHDVFDNSVAVASFVGKAREHQFKSIVTIEHTETLRPAYRLLPEARFFPFSYSKEDYPNLELGLLRRYPSTLVDAWAKKFVSTAKRPQSTMVLLKAIVLGTRKQLVYSRRIERGTQTPEQTLRRSSGTCRDFALLMIEAVRSLGLAARFVSGYIFVPESVFSDTVGGGATHAWLQVYLPGAGWVDFDPTNNIIGNRNLIRVAVTWDPADALPLWGTFEGAASSFLGLDVTVSVTDETPEEDT